MNLKPKKSLGQNFLNNKSILSKIVDTADLTSKDIVLEIGPGTGNLTEIILKKKPKEIYVVEKDKKLTVLLYKKFGDKINIINKDILDCYNDFKFDLPIKVFGNLPYNVSTKILISFIKVENLNKKFGQFIFVFQKEVADRIIAEENTKNYGRLSIISSWKMVKSKIFDISPESFYPIPKVWSSLVTLSPKANYENLDKFKNLEHITNLFFNQRRKMIRKPMKVLFKDYEDVAINLKLDLNLRPQNLSLKKYIEICRYYESLKI